MYSEDSRIKFNQELGKNIRLRRRLLKVTEIALGARIGVHRNNVMRMEKGAAPVPVHMLLRIAAALECNHIVLLPFPEHKAQAPAPVIPVFRKPVQSERDPRLSDSERRLYGVGI